MNNNYVFFLDMDDLKNKRNLLNEKYYELVEMFKNYGKMLDDTKNFYDTESGKHFRKVADEYINYSLVKIESEFKAYIDKLDNAITSYIDYSSLIASKVDKEEKSGTL